MSEREAADRLNLMPQYVALLERDEYQALRSPSFARGYVKSYGRMLGVDESHLLRLYDTLRPIEPGSEPEIGRQRPLQLQHTGPGAVIGLGILLLLVLALWWWGTGGALPESLRAVQQPFTSSIAGERSEG